MRKTILRIFLSKKERLLLSITDDQKYLIQRSLQEFSETRLTNSMTSISFDKFSATRDKVDCIDLSTLFESELWR